MGTFWWYLEEKLDRKTGLGPLACVCVCVCVCVEGRGGGGGVAWDKEHNTYGRLAVTILFDFYGTTKDERSAFNQVTKLNQQQSY